MLDGDSRSDGFTLVICEKPDAAKRVSEALSTSAVRGSVVEGTLTFRFSSGQRDFVVCSALGHVYSVSDPFAERTVYPVFDAEWFQSDVVDRDGRDVARRISAIRKLSQGASLIVNACDFDVEGEAIGFNIIKYACQGMKREVLRAKFSTLTRQEIVNAFASMAPQSAQGLARAGRDRHLVDFMWGVNLSRALSHSVRRFRTISIGRVQGPTLGFLAEREREIRGFTPRPFWRVSGLFEKNGLRFVAPYSKERIDRQSGAAKVRDDCTGREGVVSSIRRSVVSIPPGPSFNTGELQREAFRTFGFLPARTLRMAESLYLSALISYPRTDSQKLPQSIDLGGILQELRGQAAYSREAGELLGGDLKAVQGAKTDRAHPAIHPTGELPKKRLGSSEAELYDLVVRRFLSSLAPAAKREVVSLRLAVGDHEFRLEGGKTIYQGWMAYYGKYHRARDVETPSLSVGDKLNTIEVRIEEGLEERPPRYNQGSLLERMEKEKIGTKSTRADTISTLFERGYVSGQALTLTELGLAVAKIMEKHAPMVMTSQLTRRIEERLESVEEGSQDDKEMLRETARSVSEQLVALAADESIGRDIDGALSTIDAASVLGPCPLCRTGSLKVIRSMRTRKRFVGCTNYSAGCRASAPLPQKGELKPSSPCPRCSWPVVYIVRGRHPWKLCINPACPTKAKGAETQALTRRSPAQREHPSHDT